MNARRPVESRQPGTGEAWRTYASADADAVHRAVALARAAQPAWQGTPLGERLLILRRFHEALFRRRREAADLIWRETDKPPAEALAAEVGVVLDNCRHLERAVPRLLRAPWFGSRSVALVRKRLRVVNEPFGVVGIITPWNYPLALSCGRILPALMTGNAAVYKPSEFTPSVAELIRELLADAGLPDGVLRLVHGDGETGAAVAGAVDKIFLTGSLRAGRAVARVGAERMVPVELELGGSDAAIVLADADLAHAAAGLAWGRFSNAGQSCVAPKRVFVEQAAYQPFLDAVAAVVGRLRAGSTAEPDADVGAMIRPEFRAVLEAQLADAVARGARVVATVPAPSGVFAPTVLTDVPDDARAMREETFGPLMVVAAVRDADDAVARANASTFALSASVWSRDVARAGAIALRLDAGTVAVNDVMVTAGIAELPHGGNRESGTGRVNGDAGLRAYVREKGIASDRLHSTRQPWWFGYSRAHLAGVDAFLRFAHDRSLFGRLRAVPGVLRLLLRPDRRI